MIFSSEGSAMDGRGRSGGGGGGGGGGIRGMTDVHAHSSYAMHILLPIVNHMYNCIASCCLNFLTPLSRYWPARRGLHIP